MTTIEKISDLQENEPLGTHLDGTLTEAIEKLKEANRIIGLLEKIQKDCHRHSKKSIKRWRDSVGINA